MGENNGAHPSIRIKLTFRSVITKVFVCNNLITFWELTSQFDCIHHLSHYAKWRPKLELSEKYRVGVPEF